MSNIRMTVRSKLMVAAAVVGAAALPFQAGVAHAGTPNENLATCIRTAGANMGDSFSAEIDACVDAFVAELELEGSPTAPDTTVAGSTDASGGVAVNIAVLDSSGSDTSGAS